MLVLQSDGTSPMKGTGKDDHCFRVGLTARLIGQAINKNKQNKLDKPLDLNRLEVLGILHDIGCNWERGKQHPMIGYKYLLEIGCPEDVASICLTHSFLDGDPNCTADGFLIDDKGNVKENNIVPFENEQDKDFLLNYLENHEYTLEDKIINLCDLMVTNKVIGLDNRLHELLKSKQVNPNFVPNPKHTESAQKLLSEIETLMGCKMEELFPEIKDKQKGDDYRAKMENVKKV